MFTPSSTQMKMAANLVVTSSVSKVVREIIRNNVDAPEDFADKAQLYVGSFALGGLIAERCSERVGRRIDELTDQYNNWRDEKDSTPE